MTIAIWIIGIILSLYVIRCMIKHALNDNIGPKHYFHHHKFQPSDTCPGILECSVCRYTMECDDPNYERLFISPCPGKTEENFIGD